MKNFLKKSILPVAIIMIFGSFSNIAFAEPVLDQIQFETTPLFGETNFAPGNSVTKWVKLNNDTTLSHRVIVRAINAVNTGDFKLGDAVRLVIKEGNTIWYNNTFSDFFSKPEVLLEQIPAGEQRTFDFIVTFDLNSGNDYQNSTMGFNLQIGFEDLETTTDTTTTISGESGSGGGSVSLGSKHLIISNENALNHTQLNTIIVNWDTNIPATSQVIYGLSSEGPYNLDLSQPAFGYQFATSEQDLDKILNHSIVISDLVPGQTYLYRVVSRASPPTVSYEHKFTIPLLIAFNPQQNKQGAGEVLGTNIFNTTSTTAETGTGDKNLNNFNQTQTAAALLGVNFLSWKSGWWVLLIVVFILFFIIWKRRNRQESK